MGSVSWVKVNVDMFDNRKIKYLRHLEHGNDLALIWTMLLTMAGKCNDGGLVYLTDDIPYSTDMLADELGYDVDIVKLALDKFEQLNMIFFDGDVFGISGWEEYQNTEKMEKIREQSKERMRRHREKNKESDDKNTCERNTERNNSVTAALHERNESVTVTHCYATEEDKIRKEENREDIEKRRKEIICLYHELLPSFPYLRDVSDDCAAEIYKTLQDYTTDDFRAVFTMVSESDFLKGKNDRHWCASFEWIVQIENFKKILSGKYKNSPKSPKKDKIHNFSERPRDQLPSERELLGLGGG